MWTSSLQIFYNGLIHAVRITLDAAAGGTLMGKSLEDAHALIEDMLPTTTNGLIIEVC